MKKICLILLFACAIARAVDNPNAAEQQCRAHLQALGAALKLHLIYNDGQMPAHISELYKQGFVPDLEVFSCPASGRRITDAARIDEQTDYVLNTSLTDAKPQPLLKERAGLHGGQRLVFYSDTSIRLEAAEAAVPATVYPPDEPSPAPSVRPTINTPVSSPVNPSGMTVVSIAAVSPLVRVPTLADVTNLLSHGEFNKALPLLNTLVENSPHERTPRFHRATTRILMGDLKGAISDFAFLAADNPQDYESRRVRATLELLVGDRRFALQEAEALKQLIPDNAGFCVLRGQVALVSGDLPTARQEFNRARQSDSLMADVLLNEAAQLDRAGVLKVANLDYVSVTWLKPEYYRAIYGVGNTAARMGMNQQATNALEQFLSHETTGEYADSARQIIGQIKKANSQTGQTQSK